MLTHVYLYYILIIWVNIFFNNMENCLKKNLQYLLIPVKTNFNKISELFLLWNNSSYYY